MSAESSKTDPAVRSDVTTFLGGKQKRNPLANTIFSASVKTRCEQLKIFFFFCILLFYSILESYIHLQIHVHTTHVHGETSLHIF